MDFIEQYLRFIKEAERLKAVTRTAWTHDGRRESTAEHSWRPGLFAGPAPGRPPPQGRGFCLVEAPDAARHLDL